MTDATGKSPVELTANIVSAYLSNNPTQASEIPNLISQVHAALMRVSSGRTDTPLLRSAPMMDTDEGVAAAGATWPLGRFGTAEEAAATALFLMANNYMTGQIVTVDGGETIA